MLIDGLASRRSRLGARLLGVLQHEALACRSWYAATGKGTDPLLGVFSHGTGIDVKFLVSMAWGWLC